MAKRKFITGDCLRWKDVFAFLDTLPPWQELCDQVESRAKALSEPTRRLMTVAVGVCAHNYDFPGNLHCLLNMVNTGVAKPFRWHGHVSPRRWTAINTVIVAIQGWIQEKSVVSLSRAYGLKQSELKRYLDLIGPEPSHIKRAMLKRLLWNIIDAAVHNTGLGIIGDCEEVARAEVEYRDFTEAYRWDEKQYYYQLRNENQAVRRLEDEIQSLGQSGTSFMSYIRTPIPAFCQQKTLRYQQVALFRIAEKWTDPLARPPGGIPRSEYEKLFNTYVDAISRWYEDLRLPAKTERRDIYEKVFKLLGERSELKRAIVDCLIFRSKSAQDLQEAAYYWLRDHTRHAVSPK